MNNAVKTWKARLPKRRFAYGTLQNSRVSDETIFNAHKSPKKSYKFPALINHKLFTSCTLYTIPKYMIDNYIN